MLLVSFYSQVTPYSSGPQRLQLGGPAERGKDNWAVQVAGWHAHTCTHNSTSQGQCMHMRACWPTVYVSWAVCMCTLACCSHELSSACRHACRPTTCAAQFWIDYGPVVGCSPGVGDPCLTVVFFVSLQFADAVYSIKSCEITITFKLIWNYIWLPPPPKKQMRRFYLNLHKIE